MLYTIKEVVDVTTGVTSASASHRIGRDVIVKGEELKIMYPARMYHADGVTKTTPVISHYQDLFGTLKIRTMNTIYTLQAKQILK